MVLPVVGVEGHTVSGRFEPGGINAHFHLFLEELSFLFLCVFLLWEGTYDAEGRDLLAGIGRRALTSTDGAVSFRGAHP